MIPILCLVLELLFLEHASSKLEQSSLEHHLEQLSFDPKLEQLSLEHYMEQLPLELRALAALNYKKARDY